MQLAMYKGPATGLVDTLVHWIICLATWSRYSHVELVIDGVCWSSSARDGGVRSKTIDLYSGHWDLLTIDGDASDALEWFLAHAGQHYDWLGVMRFIPPLKWLRSHPDQWFCSEAVAAALDMANPSQYSPQSLLDALRARFCRSSS